MKIWIVHPPAYSSDHRSLAVNGMGYTRGVAGFHGIIKRGYPEPADPRTVLLELRSPQCAPVLWATASWAGVVFLACEGFIQRLTTVGMTGFETCPVEVVKVATRGRRKRRCGGEPEDQIAKRGNVLDAVRDELPELRGLIVTGRMNVELVSAATSDPRIQRYLPVSAPATDLCLPFLDGERYGGQVFCTQRFVDLVDRDADNVDFTPFEEWAAQTWRGT